MESFLPLTVLGAIIGLYTVMPDYKKLRVGYSFGKMDKLMLFILILVMLSSIVLSTYMSYDTSNLNITINQITTQTGFNYNSSMISSLLEKPFNYQFLIDLIDEVSIIIIFVIFWLKFWTKKVHINDTKYFIEKVDELFHKGEYTTLISLIDDNYRSLFEFKKCGDNNNGEFNENFLNNLSNTELEKLILKSIRDETPTYNPFLLENLKDLLLNKKDLFIEKIKKVTLKSIFNYFKNKVCLITDYPKDEDLHEDIRFRLLNHNYIEKIVKYNPYFGLKIVTDERINDAFREEFAHLYFKELIRNNNSVIYREIQNSNFFTYESGYRYAISKNNRIIYQVLYKINNAYENSVYKPIGDITIDLLDEHSKKPDDYYNGYINRLMPYSSEKLSDPLFMVIHFFDIMIREAIYQKINYHMWLFYYYSFVRKISKNYKLNEHSEPKYEFPSVYSALLYEIFQNLINWIELIKRDTKNVQKELKSLDCDDEGDNIIKSSIICLNSCIQDVLKAEKISISFKIYLLNMVFKLYFDLVLNPKKIVNDYGKVLECCLVKTSSSDPECKNILKTAINSFDKPSLIDKPSGKEKLKNVKKLLS